MLKGKHSRRHSLARLIHEDFYYNRRYTATTNLRPAARPRTLNVLLGTGAILSGACTRPGSGTGTSADGRASPWAHAPVSYPSLSRIMQAKC